MRNGITPSLADMRLETKDDDERRFRFTEKMITKKIVLDFGCGDGGYLLRARNVAHEVIGIEMEQTVREALQDEGFTCYERINEVEKVDIVTMFHVLEHLPDPIAMLKEIASHLNTNGEILIEVPNADDALLSLYKSKAFADFTYWKCHIYLYTMDTLRRLVAKAGLKIKFMRQVQRYPLSNHLYWLTKKKPGGHFKYSFLSDNELDKRYGEILATYDIADTIIACLAPV